MHKFNTRPERKVQKFAAGGIGKIRLGMATKDGKPKGSKKACSMQNY